MVAPRGIDVGASVGLGAPIVLWRGGHPAAHQDGVLLPGVALVHSGDAEVDQFDLAVVEHHVLRFEVAIDDRRLLPVQVGEDVAKLDRPLGHLLDGWRRTVEKPRERLTRDVLQNEIVVAVLAQERNIADDPGVAQALDKRLLGDQSGNVQRVGGRHLFENHRLAQLLALIGDTHPAGGQEADPVASHHRAVDQNGAAAPIF